MMESSFTEKIFAEAAERLYGYCEYPAVKYKILFHFLKNDYSSEKLSELRPAFHKSDIVEELHRHQDYNGGWGPLRDKNYAAKDKFPTSTVAINRCLYIGLTIEDRDILLLAHDYLEEFLRGTSRERLYNKNERAIPWQKADICELIETIKPNNELCDGIFAEWLHIATRAYENGEYSFERESGAQHEVFLTREKRIVPMRFGLLLSRRSALPEGLEEMMLRHHGGNAYENGYFWWEVPTRLPENFYYNKTRRWFATFNYINQFRGSEIYLSGAVDWLLQNRNADGLWDFGPQVKDPWGYFGYYSTNRNFKHNRVVDCTIEVLSFFRKYLDNNDFK